MMGKKAPDIWHGASRPCPEININGQSRQPQSLKHRDQIAEDQQPQCLSSLLEMPVGRLCHFLFTPLMKQLSFKR